MRKKSLYNWNRDLHYYFGLFVSPFLVIFAVSTIALNHSWKESPAESSKLSTSVEVPAGLEGMPLARHLSEQLDLQGELIFPRNFGKNDRLMMNVVTPGLRRQVAVDRTTGTAEVKEFRTGLMATMRDLHFNPGPHRGGGWNWIFYKIWAWLADSVVYLLLFSTVSGIYIWTALKAERKIGLIILGAGCVSFLAIFVAIL